MKKTIWPILLRFCFIYCLAGCTHSEGPQSFWDRDPQEATRRTITGTLAVQDSTLLSDRYGILYAAGLELDGGDLYIRDRSGMSIFVIDKETLEYKGTISIPEGRGPEELTNIGGYDINSGILALLNLDVGKIQIRTAEGAFDREFGSESLFPRRIRVTSDQNLIVFSNYFFVNDEEYLFHRLNREGEVISSFGPVHNEGYKSVKAEGQLNLDNEGNTYYAGYGEHILKKWDREGKLLFSVASIDNYPSEANYFSSSNGEQFIEGYSQFAFYNALGSTINEDYWFILPGGISEIDPLTYLLDLYSREDGRYLFSMELSYPHNGYIAADGEYIYMLHTIDGEIYLFRYRNELRKI